ncbi:MAG: glycoside hydrolase family 2 TIM barrel-domain containing protein [Leucothrix sp.]
MSTLKKLFSFRLLSVILTIVACVALSNASFAQSPQKVTTHKNAQGWKLKVDGNDFYIKGMVWGYTPRDENYTFNLWAKPEVEIRRVLDYDFGLMKKANINAIRSFATIPPKWVTYVYQKYGIMTAINPLMGRYGATINGNWRPNTDYSDPATRAVLKKQALDDVRKYKNVPGVLMFAFGNESNYGLSWKSFEIENLPEGERNKAKAEYLYSLFNEVIIEGKSIDKNHPFTIVNGDLQYIDIIAKYSKNWDLLGVNSYRGISFTDMWSKAKAKLNVPVALFEFGSDAFNAKAFKEDQVAQAKFLKGQWQEIYQKSYGHGQEGNSIGGFVFEWRDEWWKFKQTENLDKHDRNASWENGGYSFDFVPGQNNMNEEWWGVTRLGPIGRDGVSTAEPRMAYDVLTQVWAIDPYAANKASVNQAMNRIDMKALAAASKKRYSRQAAKDNAKFRVAGGNIKVGQMATTLREDYKQNGNDGVSYKRELMANIDFEFRPNRNIEGDFTVNITPTAFQSRFEKRYGDRVRDKGLTNGGDKIELYDFQVTYKSEGYDLLGFYHVPRYHWGDKGDFFGLLRETTDMEGQDIWNAKAPFGFEFIGKKKLDGLTILAGPEVYWGANPKAMLKYQFGKDKQYSFIHSEDLDTNTDSDNGKATGKKTRQTTLQGKFKPRPGMEFRIGGMISGSHKVGDKYDRIHGNDVVEAKVEWQDTLAYKAKFSWDAAPNMRAYTAISYAGIVADGGDPVREEETQLPYSSLGNKREFELGMKVTKGMYTITPRLLYRDNIVDANPTINATVNGGVLSPGIDVRNTDDDPFSVLGNRAAKSAEIYLTYDPTPETYFYDWDNDVRENAKFAFNVGLTATRYDQATDSALFYYDEGERNATFGAGQAADDVWLLKSKMVFNPRPGYKSIVKLEAGKQQPTGKPAEASEYYSLQGKFILNNEHIFSATYKKDAWGRYDYERQFDLKYPEHVELGYTKLLDKGKKEGKSSKVGIKALYRTLDKNSDNGYYKDGEHDDMLEIQTFFEYKF